MDQQNQKVTIMIPNQCLKLGDIIEIMTQVASPDCPWTQKDISTRRTNLQDFFTRNKSTPRDIHNMAMEYKAKNNGYLFIPAEYFCKWMNERKIRPAGWIPRDNLIYKIAGDVSPVIAQMSDPVVTESVTAPTIQDYGFNEELPLKILRQNKNYITSQIELHQQKLNYWQQMLNDYKEV